MLLLGGLGPYATQVSAAIQSTWHNANQFAWNYATNTLFIIDSNRVSYFTPDLSKAFVLAGGKSKL